MSNRVERAFQRQLDSADSWSQAQTKAFRTIPIAKKLPMIGVPVICMIVTVVLFFLGARTERLSSYLKTSFPDSILSEPYDWPDGADLDGIAEIDGYAVAYSEKGFFAVFRDSVLHHMLYTNGRTCGIAEDRIFIGYGGKAYLYDAEGMRVQTADLSVLRNAEKYTGREAVVSPYTYRIDRTIFRNTIVAEADGEETTLLTQRRFIRMIFYAAAVVFFVLTVVFGLIGIIKFSNASVTELKREQAVNKKTS